MEQAALRLLAVREHSRAELERKLLARHFEPAQVAQVLDDLAERGLQSDARFTEQYIEMRRNRGYGPLRIRAELRERGLDEGLIEDWLDPRDPDWRVRLREVAERKFGTDQAVDPKSMAKRARFLEYRGFPQDAIRRLLLDE